MDTIARNNGHFEITTTRGQYAAKKILLAIGRRGTPRKLGVEGEKSPKVTYKLVEPEQYRGNRLLVVGGGDSAVEAALTLSRQPKTDVTLSYRGKVFARLKDKNREAIEAAGKQGIVNVMLESHVRKITPSEALIEVSGRVTGIDNDYVLVFIGGEVPTGLLKGLGVRVATKFGER